MIIQFNALCAFGEIAREELEEGLHFNIECLQKKCQLRLGFKMMCMATDLLGRRVLDGGHETAELVAHCFGCHPGGSGFEIDVRGAANTDACGLAGHE